MSYPLEKLSVNEMVSISFSVVNWLDFNGTSFGVVTKKIDYRDLGK